MIRVLDINLILKVAKLSFVQAEENIKCSDMAKTATQFIEDPNPKRAIIFLGSLLALDGEKNLPKQVEGQIMFVKVMTPQLC